MQKDLERKAYAQLTAWKRHPDHSTLEVSGARQVGKTYLVNKFADEHYKKKIYVNLLELSGELFLDKYYELREEMKAGRRPENPVFELMKKYAPDFLDSCDTVVIIDEIQESAEIYNRIREFTRSLKSDFIITGSYLGRILNKEFKYSSGDLDTLVIQTLSFEEFLMAVDRDTLFKEMDLFGAGEDNIYRELEELYQVYCRIGGYPAVVLEYLQSRSVEECQKVLEKIIRLFANESIRYFEDILDENVYENIFTGVARLLVREKKGFHENSLTEELQQIVVKEYSSNITKASMNRAINWLYSAGVIGFAGKIPECNILDYKARARCYFMDVGLAYYFLSLTGCPISDIYGTVNENFVFLDLQRRLGSPREMVLESPAFATWKNSEIDYFIMTYNSRKVYLVEVKSGKNNNKTINHILESIKADYILYLKGNTHGGISGNTLTIPIYGISKFNFENFHND